MNVFEQGLRRYLSQGEIERLGTIRVGIAGAGGLGSNCAWMLARSGFRRFVVADHDVVDASNLNRQFFFARQLGMPKVEALRANLEDINPDVQVRAVQAEVTPGNVRELFQGCDAVVEAFDAAPAKRMIVEAFLGAGVFLVAASGLAGCGDCDRIVTRRVKEDFHVVGDMTTQAGPDCPPLAPCVTLAAAKQADLVLSWAIGRKP